MESSYVLPCSCDQGAQITKTNRAVGHAMLAFPALLFARNEPVIGKNQRGISTRERGKACVGWLVGMEDLGGIIDVGDCIEVNLKDECPFELREDMTDKSKTRHLMFWRERLTDEKSAHFCSR